MQKKFFKKSSSVTHNFLAPCRNSEKSHDTIPRKHPDRRQDWTIDRPLHRTFLATAGGPTSITTVDWHLNVKDIECNVGLTKNYCITVSMQKISSIHKLNLKIQWILWFHKLNSHVHFWTYFEHTHPKIHWNNFQLSWICTSMLKNSSFQFHLFTFKI